jgi:ribosomal protein L12E/L44/L45/RPP1/RPP2
VSISSLTERSAMHTHQRLLRLAIPPTVWLVFVYAAPLASADQPSITDAFTGCVQKVGVEQVVQHYVDADSERYDGEIDAGLRKVLKMFPNVGLGADFNKKKIKDVFKDINVKVNNQTVEKCLEAAIADARLQPPSSAAAPSSAPAPLKTRSATPPQAQTCDLKVEVQDERHRRVPKAHVWANGKLFSADSNGVACVIVSDENHVVYQLEAFNNEGGC